MKIVFHLVCDSFVLTCTLSWAVDLSSRACSWFKWSLNIPSWCPLPSSNLSLQPGQRQDPWLSRGWGWPLPLFPEGDVRVGEWGWVGVGGDRIDSAPSVVGLVLPLARRWWWWPTFSPLIWKWNASGCRLYPTLYNRQGLKCDLFYNAVSWWRRSHTSAVFWREVILVILWFLS